MRETIIINGVISLLSTLSPTALKIIAENILDLFEDAIVINESNADDKVLRPLIDSIRAATDLSDNDTPQAA